MKTEVQSWQNNPVKIIKGIREISNLILQQILNDKILNICNVLDRP